VSQVLVRVVLGALDRRIVLDMLEPLLRAIGPRVGERPGRRVAARILAIQHPPDHQRSKPLLGFFHSLERVAVEDDCGVLQVVGRGVGKDHARGPVERELVFDPTFVQFDNDVPYWFRIRRNLLESLQLTGNADDLAAELGPFVFVKLATSDSRGDDLSERLWRDSPNVPDDLVKRPELRRVFRFRRDGLVVHNLVGPAGGQTGNRDGLLGESEAETNGYGDAYRPAQPRHDPRRMAAGCCGDGLRHDRSRGRPFEVRWGAKVP